MKLTLSPIAGLPGQSDTTASVAGDVLTVDGVDYNLSAIPEGAEATPEGNHPFIGTITRTAGEIVATVLWRYSEGAADQPTDPSFWIVTVADGPVPSPIMEAAE